MYVHVLTYLERVRSVLSQLQALRIHGLEFWLENLGTVQAEGTSSHWIFIECWLQQCPCVAVTLLCPGGFWLEFLGINIVLQKYCQRGRREQDLQGNESCQQLFNYLAGSLGTQVPPSPPD